MIIDAYTQMGPGIKNHESSVLRPIYDTSTGRGLIDVLDQAGIDKAATFAPRWIGGAFHDPTYEAANRAVFDAVQEFPDRLIGYGKVNPNWGAAAVRELERCLTDYGFAGAMLDPDWENFDPMNRALVFPLMELIQSKGVPVLFHCGFIPAQPALFWDLALAFPDVPIILSHLGQRLTADVVTLAQRLPNIYIETSDHMYRIGTVIKATSIDRFVFGSNLPFSTPEAELYKVTMRWDLPDDDKELILSGNFKRLHSMD